MALQARIVEERPANWLPLPFEEPLPVRRQAVVDEGDFFAKGEVTAFYAQQGEGMVKNRRGESIPFCLSEATLIGDRAGLEPGSTVGYDVSVTSGGMRITAIKVY